MNGLERGGISVNESGVKSIQLSSAWLKVTSLLLSHHLVPQVIEALRVESCGWPSLDAQYMMLRILRHCESYPLSIKYHRLLLKVMVDDIEKLGAEVADDLMECVVEAYSTPLPCGSDSDVAHYSYTIPKGSVPIKGWSYNEEGQEKDTILVPLRVLRDDNLVGMKTWEAGFLLAELCFACSPKLFAGKRILELGAGIGSTACLLSHALSEAVPESIVLTDFAEVILENLEYNVDICTNACQYMKGKIITQYCDWRSILTPEDIPENMVPADVTLIADCTYSEDIIDHVLRTIACIITSSKSHASSTMLKKQHMTEEDEEGDDLLLHIHERHGPIALLACTHRSDETFAHLQRELLRMPICCKDISDWANQQIKGGLLSFGNRERIQTYCIYSESE